MSLNQRLVPASKLETLGKYTYGNASEGQSSKRRRKESTFSPLSTPSTADHSGYISGADVLTKHSPTASESEAAVKAEPDSVHRSGGSQKRRRVNNDPLSSSRLPTDLVQGYLSRTHPMDRQRYQQPRLSTSSAPAAFKPSTRDADLEITSAQHQIALARQQLYTFNKRVQASQPDKSHLGWPAGLEPACSSNLSTRLFDGCRIVSYERNFLDLLLDSSQDVVEHRPQLQVALTTEKKKEAEAELTFAGLTMPAHLDDEEPEHEPGAYHDGTAGSGFDDLFKLKEAGNRA